MKNRIFLFKPLLISLFLSAQIFAGQKTFNVTSGSWGTAGSWYPTGVPAATDTVTISNGSTCSANITTTVAALIFNPGAASSINFTNNRTLTITGSVRIKDSLTVGGSNSGSLTINGNLIIDSDGMLIKSNGNITVSGTTLISGTLIINSTGGTKTFIGLVNITNTGVWNSTVNEAFALRGGLTNYGTFTSGMGTYTFNTNSQSLNGNPIFFAGAVTVANNITVTNNTIITVAGNLTGGGTTANFTNSAGNTLNVNGSVMSTGVLTATAAGNTVNYYRAGNQTVKGTAYFNLTLSGSGTKTTT
ncbi:MAG TPA: hypothetical protein VMT35_14075, partial [Ignavibacteriaceae bacterium]|nr:hypothetical protein [Ignavibacteriaceae bacterium]